MTEIQFLALPDGRRIAYRHLPGTGPAIVFLPGYMSDMAGSKAGALMAWAHADGRECLLFDYSGCGSSAGAFAQGTLDRWTEEALAVIDARVSDRLILVGSSMGGWVMLLAGLALAGGPHHGAGNRLADNRLAGLVGLAPAPDFTDWGYDEVQKQQLSAGETVFEASAYGPEPTPTHPEFWTSGQANLLLEREIGLDVPVRLLHGQRDADVPPAISLRLAEALRSHDVQLTLVKDGDHRLSREADVELLLRTVAALA
jgi:pimeloyl-ACP methyl ester carboxylesterase